MNIISKIKTNEVLKNTIKTLDKGAVALQKTKNNIVSIKQKSESITDAEDMSATDYGDDKVRNVCNVIKNETSHGIKKAVDYTRKKGLINKKNSKIKRNSIKKETSKTAIETSRRMLEQGKILAQKSTAKTIDVTKKISRAVISSIKAIIVGLKSLITILTAGGFLALITILIICLIGLLISSIFGIFFSGEKTSKDSITMQDAIIDCNQELSDKLEEIQNDHSYDEYILDGNVASWKDILIIYAVKHSNGNEQEVVTMNEEKKEELKKIFWDMNSLSYEVKEETAIEKGINESEKPKEVKKKVLRITISSKTSEQMKKEYNFNSLQEKQYNELLSDEYFSLWSGIIYGLDSGEYINWRQINAPWSDIKIGNTTSTISDIGCLVTSIAILIKKSGVDTSDIIPFNPGTFVETLNDNGGFSKEGNLQYHSLNKIVPNFTYVGKVNLKGKTKEEKFKLISKYYNDGYYLTVEVKGATKNNQHWVAVIGINGNSIIMVDPASNHTDMWNAYEHPKTSQFNYFKVK